MDKVLIERLQKINTNEVLNMTMRTMANYLVDDLNLFETERDLKLFILEYLERSFKEDASDWPIRYYSENEMPERTINVKDINEQLTDEYVQSQLDGVPKVYAEKH